MKSYQPTFQQEVGTLGFSVALAEDKLTIMLRDYVDQAVYSRDYTKDDVGAEIDSRAGLTDIWTALSQPITDDKGNRLQHYEVGSVVKCGGSPSYKIGKGGRVTVFHTAIEESTKEQTTYARQLRLYIGSRFRGKLGKTAENPKFCDPLGLKVSSAVSTYESNLTLTKVNYITEIEKVTNNNLDENNQNNQQLQKRVTNLEVEYPKIKDSLEVLKNQASKSMTPLNVNLASVEEKVSKQKNQLQKQQNQLSDQAKRLSQQSSTLSNQSKQLSDQSSALSKQQEQILDQSKEIQRQEFKLYQNSIRISRRLEQFQEYEQLKSDIKSIQESLVIHSLYQPSSGGSFSKDELKLQLVKFDGNWWQYIFNKPIYPRQPLKFKLRIVKTQYASIMVGVVDYAKEGANKSSYKSGNALTYEGFEGTLYPQRVKEGGGFRENDVVEVEVNRANKTIMYSVNNTLKATQTNYILDDSHYRVFFPYVELNHSNDSVEWLLD